MGMAGSAGGGMATRDSVLHCFQQANQRMAGLPVHNPALQVEVRGVQPLATQDGVLIAVLITPWCMNLILLRQAGAEPWQGFYTGLERDLALPCGPVRFVVGDDGNGGFYQMCSLFSPMDDFPDHAMAQEVADETLKAVLTPPAGVEVQHDVPVTESAPDAGAEPEGVSRRGLLRGWRREDR